MAKKKGSSNKNDFLEILMLTCFMCALFFGAWGGYLHFKKADLKERVDQELSNLNALEKLFKQKKSKDTYIRDARQKQSTKDANSFRQAIADVIKSAGNQLEVNGVRSSGKPKSRGNMREDKAAVDFIKGGTLGAYVEFYGRLSVLQPHIRVESINLSRANRGKRGGTSNSDSWTNSMSIISYIHVEKENSKKPVKTAKAAPKP